MEKISNLQVSAIFKIPDGKIEEFKQKSAEIMKEIRDKGTPALIYDIFISSDQRECEVREEYKTSEDFIEHIEKFTSFIQSKLFNDFPIDHVVIYGNPSPKLLEMAKGFDFRIFSYFQGLERKIELVH